MRSGLRWSIIWSMTRVALVTGAASGIGAAVSAELADNGWQVAGLDLRQADGLAASMTVDVSDPHQVRAAVETIRGQLGPIDALVKIGRAHV